MAASNTGCFLSMKGKDFWQNTSLKIGSTVTSPRPRGPLSCKGFVYLSSVWIISEGLQAAKAWPFE